MDFLFIGQFWDLGKVDVSETLVKIRENYEINRMGSRFKNGDKNMKSSLIVINCFKKSYIPSRRNAKYYKKQIITYSNLKNEIFKCILTISNFCLPGLKLKFRNSEIAKSSQKAIAIS